MRALQYDFLFAKRRPSLRRATILGDNLHPSDAGYHAMADAVDPSLFGAKNTVAATR